MSKIDWQCPRCLVVFPSVPDPGNKEITHRCRPSRGLGDTVKKIIDVASGSKIKQCTPCKNRQGKLNAAFPSVMPTSYITTELLATLSIQVASKLPSKCIVIGMARSGMIPASIIATYNHCSLYSLDLANKTIKNTGSGRRANQRVGLEIILVDDLIWSGDSMKEAESIVKDTFPESKIHKVAIIARPASMKVLDHFAILQNFHFLEWNFPNAEFTENYAFDMDGTLCDDFTEPDDDDGKRYLKAMKTMPATSIKPHKYPINIITARLEKYREPTIKWLKDQGFVIGNLHMAPWKDKHEREQNDLVAWKSQVIKDNGYDGMVESNPFIAEGIFVKTQKPVICNTNKQLLLPQGMR